MIVSRKLKKNMCITRHRICYCNITYKCNNSCQNCVSHNVKRHTNREVTIEDYIYFQNQFHFGGNDVWTISGGEPTLSDNLIQIINFCHQISSHVIMYSNGRNLKLLPNHTLEKIERIIVPIYGEENFHNNYVNSSVAFKETMKSIEKIIESNPSKIDLKLLLQKGDNMESLFVSPYWNFLRKNEHFSISRVLATVDDKSYDREIAQKADVIFERLLDLNKQIRLYDIPVCLLNKKSQSFLTNLPIEHKLFDTNVICGSSNKRYKFFPFNKPTNIIKECKRCKMSSLCIMIMQNYFCPLVSNSKIVITTE